MLKSNVNRPAFCELAKLFVPDPADASDAPAAREKTENNLSHSAQTLPADTLHPILDVDETGRMGYPPVFHRQ